MLIPETLERHRLITPEGMAEVITREQELGLSAYPGGTNHLM